TRQGRPNRWQACANSGCAADGRPRGQKETPARSLAAGVPSGGPKRDRTADLHNAIVALSQLSYGPLTCAVRLGPVGNRAGSYERPPGNSSRIGGGAAGAPGRA